MAEIPLVTRAQVNDWVSISENKDEDRFNVFVNRVQKNQLRNLLGDAMYYDMFQNVSDLSTIAAPYANLINGVAYTYANQTIQYYGLKPYIAFHYAINILFEGDNYHTDYGNAMYVDDPQSGLAATNYRMKKEIKDGYIQEANFYQNEIVKFLQENISTYTLWQQEYQPSDNRNRIIRRTIV